MKKILIFSTAYHPFIGGAEIAVKEITDRISDCEFDMITLNLDGKQPAVQRMGNINIYRIGGKGIISKLLFPFQASRLAKKLHKEKHYDATWSIMASWAGIAASFFKKKHKDVPLILTLQEGDEESYLKRYVGNNEFLFQLFIYRVYASVFKRANKTTAISTYLAKRAKETGSQGDIAVIPNGVDLTLFARQPTKESQEAIETLIKKLDKKPEETYLITTSRLVIKNGVGDIIRALADLPETVKLLILGEGPLEAELKALAALNLLEKRVLFAGHVEHSELPTYLAVSDIFIRPSLSEGMGNSFIEAMAAGVPVIATPVGGIPDFIVDNETGLFCEPHNPQSIVEKVKILQENRELRDRIVANAKDLVIRKYDWNFIAERIKNEIFAKV